MAGLIGKMQKRSTTSTVSERGRSTHFPSVPGSVRDVNRMMPAVDMDPPTIEEGVKSAQILYDAATKNIISIGELCLNMRDRFPDFKNSVAPHMPLSRARLYDAMEVAKSVRQGRLKPSEVPGALRPARVLSKLEPHSVEALRQADFDFTDATESSIKATLEKLGVEDKALSRKESKQVDIIPPAGKDTFAEFASAFVKLSKVGVNRASKTELDRLHDVVHRNPDLQKLLRELLQD